MNIEYRDIVSFDGTNLKAIVRENGCSEWLIVTHGLGEHQERHEHILKLFSQNFNICLYDLRGHGKSGGERAYVESFQDFTRDLGVVLDYLRQNFSMKIYSLLGHSMGGLITADYLQNFAKKDFYPKKVFFSSPAIGAAGLGGHLFSLAPDLFYKSLSVLPSVELKGILDLKKLSHDSRVYEAYIKDELNQLKIHSRLFFELLRTAREVFSRPLRAECPVYCAIGSDDHLVNYAMTVKYFSELEKGVSLKVFEGAYHELHNEVEKWRKPYLNYLRSSLTGLNYEAI